MKVFKMCLLLAFMGLATTASAQFVNSNTGGSNSTSVGGGSSFDFTAVKTSGWNRFYASYNPSKITVDEKNADDLDLKGFTVGYMRGFSLTRQFPLYMEVGVAFQYRNYKYDEDVDNLPSAFGDDDDLNVTGADDIEWKYVMMSLNIPVNLLYRFNFTDDFSLSPYFGFDFRFNVSGKQKWSWTAKDDDYDDVDESSSLDLFDKKDMGDKDYTWNRFQAGWHIGVGLDYKALHIGVEYGKDFNEIIKKSKLSTTSITLGVNF